MIFAPGCFSIDSETKLPTETKVFPDGQILIWESTRYSGLQGSDIQVRLSFQETSSSPREEIIGQFSSDQLNRSRLIRQNEKTLGLIIGDQTFTRCIYKGEPRWDSLHIHPNNDASQAFLNSFVEAISSDREGVEVPKYDFDHFDVDHNLMIKARSLDATRFPRYLVYSTVDYNEPSPKPQSMLELTDWKFDLDATRGMNGLGPPEIPKLKLDVEVIGKLRDRSATYCTIRLQKPCQQAKCCSVYPGISAATG